MLPGSVLPQKRHIQKQRVAIAPQLQCVWRLSRFPRMHYISRGRGRCKILQEEQMSLYCSTQRLELLFHDHASSSHVHKRCQQCKYEESPQHVNAHNTRLLIICARTCRDPVQGYFCTCSHSRTIVTSRLHSHTQTVDDAQTTSVPRLYVMCQKDLDFLLCD